MISWKRWAVVAGGLLALGLLSGLSAANKDVPSIEDIMDKCHKTKKGFRDMIQAELEKPTPDWAGIQKQTKEWVELSGLLTKNEPPQGGKESWTKLTAAYVADVKALDAAAVNKDAKLVMDVNKKIGMSCKACHDEHR